MKNQNRKIDDMGKAPIWSLLFRFSGPSILSNVVGASYNTVDTIFVGRLGTNALAAMTISNPIMMSFMAIETGTAIGAASLVSRKLGAGMHEEASRVAGIATTLALIIGGFIALICLPNLESILHLFGANNEVMHLAKRFLSIIIIFAFVDAYYMIMGNLIRAEGSPVFSSVIFIISALSNIILDPILIYGWGIPAMGIAGAAVATVIARAIGALCFLFYFIFGKSSYRFKLRYFIPTLSVLKEIYWVGFASIVRMSGWSIMSIFVNRVAISFGVTTLAVFGVITRSDSFAIMPVFGISQGMMPLVGYNYGAKNMARVGEVIIKSGKVVILWGFLCTTIVLLFPTQILSLFNTQPQFLQEGINAIRIYSICYLFVGLQFNISYFFQAIGKGTTAVIVGMSRQFLFLLPAIYLFSFTLGKLGIWIAFPVAEALTVISAFFLFIRETHKSGIPFHLQYPNQPPIVIKENDKTTEIRK